MPEADIRTSFPQIRFDGRFQMTLFVSMADVACALRTTLADLRAARRVFRPQLHVVRARTGSGGRGPDLLALEGLLAWLNSAVGGGLDPETAADIVRCARLEREFDTMEVPS
jgi:hypothetical protein